jgi:hypothetical protein
LKNKFPAAPVLGCVLVQRERLFMNKKNSWLITLLLAALVPLATGCSQDDCDKAGAIEDGSNNLASMIQHDLDVAQDRTIDWRTKTYQLRCEEELRMTTPLNGANAQKFYKDGPDAFCDDDGKKNGLCESFKNVKKGALGYNTSYDDDLSSKGVFNLLRDACNEQSAGGKLDIGNVNNPHSKNVTADVAAMLHIFTMQINSNTPRLRDKVCGKLLPRKTITIVSATVPPATRAQDTPGTYQPAIVYGGPAKPNAPVVPQPQPPTQAPQPGEVPKVPSTSGSAAAPVAPAPGDIKI